MSVLPYQEILKRIKEGNIKILPSQGIEKRLGPAGIDLRLGNHFRIFKKNKTTFIDVKDSQNLADLMEKIVCQDYFLIHPGEFVLGETLEEIEIPEDLSAKLEGRSSLGRLGIQIHSTAGHFDPGFKGRPTLEISNIGVLPIKLYPGMLFCQLIFHSLTEKTKKPYKGRYLNQKGAPASKIFQDFYP